MKPFLVRWLVTTAAVAIAAHLVPDIRYSAPWSLCLAALLLGVVNAFVRPVLLLLSAPLIILTLGIFILIINALMLWMVSSLVPGFQVHSFTGAFLGALIISIISWLFSAFFKGSDGRIYPLNHHEQVRRVKGRVIE